MPRIFQPLFLFLAHATHRNLIQQIQFLKIENEVLRCRLPARITVTPNERQRLVKYGRPVGKAIQELITIVSPRTFARWLAEKKKETPRRRRGRPPTSLEIRELILRLARENSWGYTRILGELKKLGIFRVGRTTIQNLLRAHGLDPHPERKRGTWNEFIRQHAETLWACDFMTRRIWTWRGRVDCFLLFFIHVGSRKVWVSSGTPCPTGAWVAQQARNFSIHLQETGQQLSHLLRDRDCKFTGQFDAIIKTSGTSGGGGGVKVCRLPVRSPNLNAYAERWCQSLQTECLNHFFIFGERHLDHLVNGYVDYYHRCRPHQSRNNEPLYPLPVQAEGEVLCEERLGGLLRHYYRRAA